MNNKEIITEIIEDLEQTVGLNWPSTRSKITRKKLIECWSVYRNIQDFEFYGYAARSSTNSVYRKIFNNIEKKNSRPWKSYILNLYKYKYCTNCKTLENINNFSDNGSKLDGKDNWCKNCSSIYHKQLYANNIEKEHERSKKYYEAHKEEAFARSASRRASKIERMPSWVNKKELTEIYRNCPEGYHVDHKIPLNGKLVSGLHVPENLQYLTAEENLRKSNKYEVK